MKAWDFRANTFIERSRSLGSRLRDDKDAVFDFDEGRYKKPWSYNKRQRRAFHRCISGLLRAKGRLDRIRFMTLTSSPRSDKKKLNYHFPRRVKKNCPLQRRMRGFVPHAWLSRKWEKIHGAKIVEIHELKGKKSERDIASYVVGNYVSKQPIKRMSYSQKWVCLGFSKKWKTFLEVYGQRAVEVWDRWLLTADLQGFRNSKLDSFDDKYFCIAYCEKIRNLILAEQ